MTATQRAFDTDTDRSQPVQFSLLRARLAVLAATAGGQPCPVAAPPARNAPVLDMARFSALGERMSRRRFSYFVCRYLLDVEFHLEEIARARADRECELPGIAGNAGALAAIAADIGAMRTSALARRLQETCQSGNRLQTRSLILALSESCIESEMALRGHLAAQAFPSGGV